MVGQSAPIEGEPSKIFPIMGSVHVSLPAALKFLEDAYRHFDARGARVKLSISSRCLFVGQS